MKKVVLLVVVLAVAWIGFNYVKTGHFALLPTTMTAEEEHLQDLEQALVNVNSQMAQAGRMAGMTGTDTTADVAALMEKKTRLEKEIAEAKKKVAPR